jgi:hypothetical protein
MGVPARHRERSGEAGGPPGNRRVLVSLPEWYVAGAGTRGRQEGRPYPWSQQVIHEISGLGSRSKRDICNSFQQSRQKTYLEEVYPNKGTPSRKDPSNVLRTSVKFQHLNVNPSLEATQ